MRLVPLLVRLSCASYSCSTTDKNFPYFLGNSNDDLVGYDICLSADNSRIGLVGKVSSGIAWMGSSDAGFFAVVENSLDMDELAV